MIDWQAALEDWLAEPHKFGHLLDFEKLTPAHDEWINFFLRVPQGGIDVLMAHRNSYKTTCGLVAMTLLFLLYPEIRILVARKTDTQAAKVAIALQKIFTTNAVVRLFMRARFGIDTAETPEWSTEKTNFAFKRTVTIEPSLTIAGIAGSITGAHFDYIWCDDIITRKDRESGAEREATKNFVHELDNLIEPTGSQMFTGTPWHEEDAFSLLPPAKKYPIKSIVIPGIDDEWIARKKERTPVSLWCANYELTHVFSDDVIGAIDFIDAFTAEYRVAFIDPSFSNSKGSDRCSVAVVGFAKQPGMSEYQIQFTGVSWEKSISHPDVIREMLLFLDKYRPVETQLESQLSDSTINFIEPFKIMERRLGLKVKNNWTWKHQAGNKHSRITTHVTMNKFRLRAIAGTDDTFMRFVCGYSKTADVKDPADSVAGGVELWQSSPYLQQYIKLKAQADALMKTGLRGVARGA